MFKEYNMKLHSKVVISNGIVLEDIAREYHGSIGLCFDDPDGGMPSGGYAGTAASGGDTSGNDGGDNYGGMPSGGWAGRAASEGASSFGFDGMSLEDLKEMDVTRKDAMWEADKAMAARFATNFSMIDDYKNQNKIETGLVNAAFTGLVSLMGPNLFTSPVAGKAGDAFTNQWAADQLASHAMADKLGISYHDYVDVVGGRTNPFAGVTEDANEEDYKQALKSYFDTEDGRARFDSTMEYAAGNLSYEDFVSYTPQYEAPEAPDFEALKTQLTDISNDVALATQLRDLGDLTGGLSEDETSLLDQIEENSRLNLSEMVNSQTEDTMKTAIADMVDKGVLQGSIGAETLKRIDDARTTTLTQGYRDIASSRLNTEIGLREAQKGRQMDLWQMGQEGALAGAQLEQTGAIAGAELDWKDYLAKTQQAQYQTGLESDWQKSLLDSYTRMYAADKSASSASNIASMQKDYADNANMWGAIGNIGGGIADAVDWGDVGSWVGGLF